MLLDTIHKIQRVWDRHGFLQADHHGFRHQRSTDTVTLQIMALFETALTQHLPLYVALFDAKSEFDTVTRYLQRLTWERGGIPAKVAIWLFMMDANGTIIPRIPLSEHQIHSVYSGNYLDIPRKLNAHRHDAAYDPGVIKGFNTERDAPQGGGPSILLRALQLAHERQLVTRDGNVVSSFHYI